MGTEAGHTISRAEAKRTTRRALLEAGLAEIGERGLVAPSLDAICLRAGYTRGAFYVHFENREHFIVEVMDWALERVVDEILGAPDADRPLHTALRRFADGVASDTWGIRGGGCLGTERILEALDRSEKLRERSTRLLERLTARLTKAALRGQENAQIRRDVSATDIAGLIVMTCTGALRLRQARLTFDVGQLHASLLKVLAD